MNIIQQHETFDRFVTEFNTERPDKALDMKVTAEIYSNSAKPYKGLPVVEYPMHARDILMSSYGRICPHRKKTNISTVLAG